MIYLGVVVWVQTIVITHTPLWRTKYVQCLPVTASLNIKIFLCNLAIAHGQASHSSHVWCHHQSQGCRMMDCLLTSETIRLSQKSVSEWWPHRLIERKTEGIDLYSLSSNSKGETLWSHQLTLDHLSDLDNRLTWEKDSRRAILERNLLELQNTSDRGKGSPSGKKLKQ